MNLLKRSCPCPWLTRPGSWLTLTLISTHSFSHLTSSSFGVVCIKWRWSGALEWPCKECFFVVVADVIHIYYYCRRKYPFKTVYFIYLLFFFINACVKVMWIQYALIPCPLAVCFFSSRDSLLPSVHSFKSITLLSVTSDVQVCAAMKGEVVSAPSVSHSLCWSLGHAKTWLRHCWYGVLAFILLLCWFIRSEKEIWMFKAVEVPVCVHDISFCVSCFLFQRYGVKSGVCILIISFMNTGLKVTIFLCVSVL